MVTLPLQLRHSQMSLSDNIEAKEYKTSGWLFTLADLCDLSVSLAKMSISWFGYNWTNVTISASSLLSPVWPGVIPGSGDTLPVFEPLHTWLWAALHLNRRGIMLNLVLFSFDTTLQFSVTGSLRATTTSPGCSTISGGEMQPENTKIGHSFIEEEVRSCNRVNLHKMFSWKCSNRKGETNPIWGKFNLCPLSFI